MAAYTLPSGQYSERRQAERASGLEERLGASVNIQSYVKGALQLLMNRYG